MGTPPFSDERERIMLEQSLQTSLTTLRCRALYNWEHRIMPFGNWALNAVGLFMLMICSISTTIAGYAMNYWVLLMDKLGRRRIIMDRVNDEPYLERYYIFMKDRNETFPFNVFIHKFLKSDPDDLHNHPWGFFTFIIAGGYWEYTYEEGPPSKESPDDVPSEDVVPNLIKKWRGPGFFQSVSADHTHRIELDPERSDCWTLFIPRLRIQKWGFFKNNCQWIESDQYLDDLKKDT